MEGSVKPNDISLSTALLSSLPNAEGVWRDQALCWEHTSTGDILLEVYSYLIDLTCMSVWQQEQGCFAGEICSSQKWSSLKLLGYWVIVFKEKEPEALPKHYLNKQKKVLFPDGKAAAQSKTQHSPGQVPQCTWCLGSNPGLPSYVTLNKALRFFLLWFPSL